MYLFMARSAMLQIIALAQAAQHELVFNFGASPDSRSSFSLKWNMPGFLRHMRHTGERFSASGATISKQMPSWVVGISVLRQKFFCQSALADSWVKTKTLRPVLAIVQEESNRVNNQARPDNH
jgi:hypothetical protein